MGAAFEICGLDLFGFEQVAAGAGHRDLAVHHDIATMRELGYQEELFGIWFSFLAPQGIPEDARKALVGAIEQAVKAPTVTARLASLGILQSYATPEQTAAEIRAEFRRAGEIARKTGLVK